MSKQVQVLIVCDWCKRKWSADDEEAPVEREWSWNGGMYVLELCQECLPKVREHLQPLFGASAQKKKRGPGRPPISSEQKAARSRRVLPRGSFDKYKNQEGKYECPADDCGRTFDYPQHLGNHHNGIHGSYLD